MPESFILSDNIGTDILLPWSCSDSIKEYIVLFKSETKSFAFMKGAISM